jgi:hypothetical protein
MNHRTHNNRLMRRLGFVADPKTKPQIVPANQATYWRHQPSGALVVAFHRNRLKEANVVRYALSSAIGQTLSKMQDKVNACVSAARRENEKPS